MVAGEDGRQLVEEYIADIVSHVSLLGQTEKKNVSGVAPGWVKISDQKKKCKKNKKCSSPTGHDIGHPLDRKQIFFRLALDRREGVPVKRKLYSSFLL